MPRPAEPPAGGGEQPGRLVDEPLDCLIDEPPDCPVDERFDCLILGAGVAGLAAALECQRSGLRPLLLEAAGSAGGRARSYRDRLMGEELDNGPHLLLGAYHQTLALLETIGTRHLLHPVDRTEFAFFSPERGHYRFRAPDWPAPLHLLGGLVAFPPLTWKERLAALAIAPALLVDPHRWETLSVTHWLQKWRQPQALFDHFWGPLCLAALNEPPASANAALFATVLRRAFFGDRRHSQPLIATVPFSRLLAEPAAARITRLGGRILTAHRVRSLRLNGARVEAVETDCGSWAGKARPIIAALPPRALSELLPDWAEETGFGRLATAAIVSIHLTYPRPARIPGGMIGLPFGTGQWLFDRQFGNPTPLPEARISAVISGAYREIHLPRETLVATVRKEIARAIPALAEVAPQATRVIKERRATFATWPETTHLRPGPRTPWENLFLAGDFTATGLPATLEGAVISGQLAARAVFGLLSSRKKAV
ncbi:MAG: FAD-dependent oxidoreductase [Magnetococcales bacterium]|nr:FAD-dependent oxidoreductase [Magnetococcales bacterium]